MSLGRYPQMLLGVDRFMSEARAITNTIGNGVGTMAIAKWVGALDVVKMHKALNGEVEAQKSDAVQVAVAHETPSAPGSSLLPPLNKVSKA